MSMRLRLMTNEDEQVGRRLKSVRVEHGLLAKDIAGRLGMTAGNYAHYESGRNRLGFVDVRRFAEAMGLTPEVLAQRLGLTLHYDAEALRAAAASSDLAEREAALDAILADPEFTVLFSQIGRKLKGKGLTPGERRLLLANLKVIVNTLYPDDE
jgi:transcriptional regulator with XRE-family HTH domain